MLKPTPVTIYWSKSCSTCKNAASHLASHNDPEISFRDIKLQPLGRSEIQTLAARVGGVENLFSRRAKKYLSMQLNLRVLSEDEMLDLMESDYTFIKRPVLIVGSRGIAGFNAKLYDELLRNL